MKKEQLKKQFSNMSVDELKELEILIHNETEKRDKQLKDQYTQWKKENMEEINFSWILLEIILGRWPNYDDTYIIYNFFTKETIRLGGHPSHFGIDAIEIYDANQQLIDEQLIFQIYQSLKDKNLKNKEICDLFRNTFQVKKSYDIQNMK